MLEMPEPVTRFRVMALELGWLNWTVAPAPTEKSCQLMMALEEFWFTTVVAPEDRTWAWPATTEAPTGWALAWVRPIARNGIILAVSRT